MSLSLSLFLSFSSTLLELSPLCFITTSSSLRVSLSLFSWLFPPKTHAISLSRAVLYETGINATIFSILLPRHSPTARRLLQLHNTRGVKNYVFNFLPFLTIPRMLFHSHLKFKLNLRKVRLL